MFASLSLSHTLLYTHTQMHTDTYTYSLPHLSVITISTCAALQWHLFSLSSNHSLYLQRLYLLFSVGLLCHAVNVISPLVVYFRDLTLSCLAWRTSGVLLLPPVSPVPWAPSRLESPGPDLLLFCFAFFIQFWVYVWQTVFVSSLKTVSTTPFALGSFTPLVTLEVMNDTPL